MVDVDDIGKPGATYIAMGYPATKNAKIDTKEKTLKRRPASYTANILPSGKLDGLGVHSGSHLLIAFEKRHSRDRAGRDITAPDPFGMSGGPLWRFDVFSDVPGTRLVGMLIEWKSEAGGILAVRLPVVLAGIARNYPSLTEFIPKTSTVQVDVQSPTPPDA